jgi:hypothetical protein
MTEDFIQKLLLSKKIMEKSDSIKRGDVRDTSGISESYSDSTVSKPSLQEFSAPNATYNIPQELMVENKPVQTKPFTNSTDKILNSKLPDAIKQLMIEHPIDQPQQKQVTLTDDLIERAARLMNIEKNPIVETATSKKNTIPQQQSIPVTSDLRKMLKEVITEVLTEKGLIHESEQGTQQAVQIKVGNHIFEGKILKIKKVK